nr:YetF domain-containing protein [Salsipaludibacter albus]
MQGGFAALRRRVNTSRVENDPVLLMDGGRILEDNLAATRVTRDDLYAKLREANVLNLDQVRAVVLETTGDVSVLHGPADQFDPDLLASVRRDAAILPFRRR